MNSRTARGRFPALPITVGSGRLPQQPSDTPGQPCKRWGLPVAAQLLLWLGCGPWGPASPRRGAGLGAQRAFESGLHLAGMTSSFFIAGKVCIGNAAPARLEGGDVAAWLLLPCLFPALGSTQ